MKIAVYTIAKNEAGFVARWAESCKDADYRIILDTGSSDNTVSLARDLGVTVIRHKVEPWRFDEARNVTLQLVPHDAAMCIALDMDEVLIEGWREELERAIADGVTRPRYKYTWSWTPRGTPDLQYGGDKIHTRHGYIWKHPVHEVLVPLVEERQGWYDLEIHHHPDPTKSRGQYLPLLELAVQEDPEDDRNSHYLAREYYFAGRFEEAAAEFHRHLSLKSAKWKPERAASYRYLAKCEPEQEIDYLFFATEECPENREAWAELSQACFQRENWVGALHAATKGLGISERPLTYLTQGFAWGPLLHDIAAVSAYNLGYFHEAKYHGMEALKMDPYDARLSDNMKWYLEAAA